jgi:hypothetical protein
MLRAPTSSSSIWSIWSREATCKVSGEDIGQTHLSLRSLTYRLTPAGQPFLQLLLFPTYHILPPHPPFIYKYLFLLHIYKYLHIRALFY